MTKLEPDIDPIRLSHIKPNAKGFRVTVECLDGEYYIMIYNDQGIAVDTPKGPYATVEEAREDIE